jgi:sugar phosphate isomerase/epimerase
MTEIRSCVTICLVEESRGGPFVFWHDLPGSCQRAKELGFDAVEIFPPSAEAVDQKQLRSLLSDHGLTLAAVGTGAGWVRSGLHLGLPDAGARAKARAFIRSIIDLAGAFQASAIIGSMQGRSGNGVGHASAVGYLADALEELGEHARQYQAPLLFEPLNRYETDQVNTIGGGVQLLQSLSTKNVLLLADLFHMNIEEADIAGALWESAGYLGHLHFVDSNRRAAGLGHLNYAPIVRSLRTIGYQGYASAEALPYPDSEGAARQTIRAFRQYLQRH